MSVNTIETPIPKKRFIIVVRADPIICGHSTEARNLAEAAIASGYDEVRIVSYPIDVLKESGLPLKPLNEIMPYAPGVFVDRPEAVGDYKVVDGRLLHGMSGHLLDLLMQPVPDTTIMDLYLVPHGKVVMDAVAMLRASGVSRNVHTISEAVGSDITNVVRNAVEEGRFGAAQIVLSTYLSHDQAVAVSAYTKQLIVEAGAEVDRALGTTFEHQLTEQVGISYPAINTDEYFALDNASQLLDDVMTQRQLAPGDYILFLSRLAAAKGVDDLIHAYRASKAYGKLPLIICGNGPHLVPLLTLAAEDPHIRFLNDVSDAEKPALLRGAAAYVLPTKPQPAFIETFGIAVAEKMLAGGLGPVITTRVGGVPEATGDHCLYVEHSDPTGLAAMLDYALFEMTAAEKEQLSSQAREYATQFDRHHVLSKLFRHSNKSLSA